MNHWIVVCIGLIMTVSQNSNALFESKMTVNLPISKENATPSITAMRCMLVQILLQQRHFLSHDYLIEVRRSNGKNNK